VDTESLAVYADFTFDLTDKLSLIFGSRYSEDDKSLNISATAGGTPGFENNGFPTWDNATLATLGIPTELDFDEFIPRLGVEYHFTDDVLGYLTYTEGYKSGGWGARTNNPAEVTPFNSEFVNSIALGLKATLFNGQVRLNSEAFFYDYENLFNTGTGAGGNFIVATNDAEVYGLEIEGTGRISDAFDVFGYVAFMDGEYKGVDPNASFVGGELQRLPELSFKVGGTYTWDLPAGNIRLTADYSFQKDHFTNLQNTELARSGDIKLVNTVLGYDTDDGRFGIALSCRNCADNEYVVQSLDFAGFGFITLYPGEPRTWLVTVSARTK
jgi:iron complex outermembrane receptor protein